MTVSHLIGQIKTALFNANKAEAKCAELEQKINTLQAEIDFITEVDFDQEIRLTELEQKGALNE